jgi:predicted outer membrane repeat protein
MKLSFLKRLNAAFKKNIQRTCLTPAPSRSCKGSPKSLVRLRHGLELLEDRVVPAVLTVNTFADTSNIFEMSLRNAIAIVDSGNTSGLSDEEINQIAGSLGQNDTIVFASNLSGTLKLTSPLPEITANVQILGLGASQLTIDGGGQNQIFSISSTGLNVSISGLTLANGQAVNGGAIDLVPPDGGQFGNSNLTVNKCTFTGNQASNDGGGIAFHGGSLTLNNCTLTNNSSGWDGGAVDATLGSMTLNNDSFSDNSSTDIGGAVDYYGPTTVQNCTFSDNSATGASPGGASANLAPGNNSPEVQFNSASEVVNESAGTFSIPVTLTGTVTPTVSTFASVPGPEGIAFEDGNLYAAEAQGFGSSVAEITPAGVVSTFATGFNYPSGLAFDASGNLYVADINGGGGVSEVTPGGVVSSYVSGLGSTKGLAFDASGNLYVANGGINGGVIDKVTSQGTYSVFASGFTNAEGLAFYNGNLFVADLGTGDIDMVTPAGVVSTFASGLFEPYGLTVDASGNLYVSSQHDNIIGAATVSEVTPTGTVTSLASGFSEPFGLACDAAGNLYVADPNASRISEVTTGSVSVPFTLGGTATLDNDYSGVTASPLIIPSGQTSASISGSLVPDPGGSKTLTFTLGTPTAGVSQGSPSVNTLTIVQPGAGAGGAIGCMDSGSLVATDDSFTGNSAIEGGAIFPSYDLNVAASTFSDNSATVEGGAIDTTNVLSAVIADSTFAGNSTAGNGGGLFISAKNAGESASVQLTNDTLAENSGDNIYVQSGANVTLDNTILDDTPGTADIDGPGSVAANSANNLINDKASPGGLTNGTNGNLVGVFPALLPLGNYGGSTETMPPVPSSPAIDAGSTAYVTDQETDQRGFSRTSGVNGDHVDIGAVEVQPTNIATHLALEGPGSALLASPMSWSATVLNDANVPAVNFSGPVSISIASGPGSFTSLPSITADAFNGVAEFNNLMIDTPGLYTIQASFGNSQITAPLTVTGGALYFSAAPDRTIVAGNPLTSGFHGSPIQVEFLNQPGGTPIAGYDGPVTLNLFGQVVNAQGARTGWTPVAFSNNGKDSVTVLAQNGIATFTGIEENQVDLQNGVDLIYLLQASVGDLSTSLSDSPSQDPSAYFSIDPASPSELVFTQQPPANAAAGQPIAPAPTVTVEDQYGNISLNGVRGIRISKVTGPGSLNSSEDGRVVETGGEFALPYVRLTTTGSYTISVSADVTVNGVTNVFTTTSNSFTVSNEPAETPTSYLIPTIGASSITLNWEDPDTTVTSYNVEESIGANSTNFSPISPTITHLPGFSGSATITGLQGGTTYVFEVQAVNATGASGWLVSGNITTLDPVVSPPQSATVGRTYAKAFYAIVTKVGGTPVAGEPVTFTAPATGPSGTFDGKSTITVLTNANGIAIAPAFTANTKAGSFGVTVSFGGQAPLDTILLTNVPGPPANLIAVSGTAQTATVGTSFATPLAVKVMDRFGNPIAGVKVIFMAPASGASGAFAGNQITVAVTTNDLGFAVAPAFTADTTAGKYQVIASASGIMTELRYSLTNEQETPADDS